jgi:hypothetical protein
MRYRVVDEEYRFMFKQSLADRERILQKKSELFVEYSQENTSQAIEKLLQNRGLKKGSVDNRIKKLPAGMFDAWKKRRGDRFNSQLKAITDKLKLINERLCSESLNCSIRTAPIDMKAYFCFGEVWLSTYANQTSPSTYANGAAALLMEKAKKLGIQTATVTTTNKTILVLVGVASTVDLEILKSRPELSLRDWAKTLMKAGCNIRVFQPFLPHGIEQKLGLDYFGNDLPAKESL